VTADPQDKVYGEADPELTYTVEASELQNDDAATVVSGGLERVAGEDVGDCAINDKDLAAPNYTINYVGADLTVTPAPLTVTADPQDKVYGEVDPELTYVVEAADLRNDEDAKSVG